MSVNKNIFYSFLTQVPTLILGIVSGIFITRILGPEGKGVYAIFQSDVELFVLIFSFSITGGLVYFVSSKKIEINKLLGLGLLLLLIGATLSAIILSLAKHFLSESMMFPLSYTDWFYFVYIFLAFCFSLFNSFVSAIFQGRSLFKFVNTISLVNSIFNVTFFTIAFIYHYYVEKIGFKAVLGLGILVFALNSILWLGLFIKHVGIFPTFKISFKKDFKPLFKFVMFDYFGHIINFLNYRLDLWLINFYLKDLVNLGYYNVAVTTAQMLWLISTPIGSVLIPYLANNLNDEKNSKFQFFSRFNFTISLILVLIAVFLAPVLIPLVYGSEFESAAPLFLALSGGVLFYSSSKIFAVYIYSAGRVQYNLIVVIIGLVFTVVFDLLLIPRIGAMGAAIASSISYISMFICTSLFLFVKVKLPFANYFILNKNDFQKIIRKSKEIFEVIRTKI